MRRKPIYVEIPIHTTIETLWEYTQNPSIHQAWDLRFSKIQYIPKENDADPQRFLYETNIGFGLSIKGEGESIGINTKKSGERISSLKFWTNNPLSLIREGGGFWRYVPNQKHVLFFTQYDYRTRYGWIGKWFDFACFRPLLGWATAWSFDCLRLWIEKGIHPQISFIRSLIHYLIVFILSFVWVYQGLVPKLLFKDENEFALLKGTGWFLEKQAVTALNIVGMVEVLFGILLLLSWNKKRLFLINIFAMIVLTFSAWISNPYIFTAPFNPTTLNLLMITLSSIGILNAKNLVNARNCKRKKGRDAK